MNIHSFFIKTIFENPYEYIDIYDDDAVDIFYFIVQNASEIIKKILGKTYITNDFTCKVQEIIITSFEVDSFCEDLRLGHFDFRGSCYFNNIEDPFEININTYGFRINDISCNDVVGNKPEINIVHDEKIVKSSFFNKKQSKYEYKLGESLYE